MWLATDSEELEAIDELEKGSDRTLGIVSAAIIDSKLSAVLRRSLGDNSSVTENGKVHMAIRKKDDNTANPKWRFSATAKLFCATLDIYLRQPNNLSIPFL